MGPVLGTGTDCGHDGRMLPGFGHHLILDRFFTHPSRFFTIEVNSLLYYLFISAIERSHRCSCGTSCVAPLRILNNIRYRYGIRGWDHPHPAPPLGIPVILCMWAHWCPYRTVLRCYLHAVSVIQGEEMIYRYYIYFFIYYPLMHSVQGHLMVSTGRDSVQSMQEGVGDKARSSLLLNGQRPSVSRNSMQSMHT